MSFAAQLLTCSKFHISQFTKLYVERHQPRKIRFRVNRSKCRYKWSLSSKTAIW